MVMYSARRQGVTDDLNLEAAGLEAGARGRIKVDEHNRTTVEHIYAVGDEIGFPALAANSMDQGRLAAYRAFGEPARELAGAAADRHLHDPRGLVLRCDRGGADPLAGAVRGRRLAVPRTGPRADPRRRPTLSGAYKVAALDVTNKIRALEAFGSD
jgi:hypothetical protein